MDVVFFGFAMFLAHSVVEDGEGKLADITPAPGASQRYPFIRHCGDVREYDRLIAESDVVQFECSVSSLE